MRSDIPFEDADGQIEQEASTPSTLDRTLALPAINIRWVVATIALVTAALLRLPGLNRWVVGVREAELALAARNLVTGGSVPGDLLGQPVVLEWISLFMFIGHTNATLGRVSMAFAGIAIIALVLALARWMGFVAASAAAVVLAFSPTLVAASRKMDGDVLLPALSAGLLLALLRAFERPGPTWWALSGLAAGLLLLSGPVGLPALVLAGLGAYLLQRPATVGSRDLGAAALAFAGTVLLFGTALFTRPSALPDGLGESLSTLWSAHLNEAGSGYHLPLFNLILNEPLILALAVLSIVTMRDRPMVLGLIMWSAASFLVLSILNVTSAGGQGLVVLPLGLLAGCGVAHIIAATRLETDRRLHGGAYVIAILLLATAFLVVSGLISGVDDNSTGESIARFLMVVGVVIAPLGLALAWLGQRLQGYRVALLITALVIVLSGVTVRSAVLAASERPGDPEDLFATDLLAQDIPVLVDIVHRVSRDLTYADRDARDPEGGHGLRIAIDERIAQPFLWYFREYPEVTTFDPADGVLPEGAQIVILAAERDAEALAPQMSGSEYVYQYARPASLASPDWGEIFAGMFSLDGWRSFGGYILNRSLSGAPESSTFQVRAIPVVGERLFARSGPYSLDERAGTGAGDGQFSQPRGIAINEQGFIYVVDAGNARVQRFTPAGGFDLAFGSSGSEPGNFGLFPGGGIGGPGGIALDDAGNVYVADTWNHRIQVFDPDGNYITSWGSFFDAQNDPELTTTQPGNFYGPRGIAYYDGQIVVTDTGNERIQIFTTDGEFVRMFGVTGSGLGELTEPVGVAVADDGTVLVADSHNARIARFTLAGEPLDPWPVSVWEGQQFFEPFLAIGTDGRVYATSSATGEIIVFDSTGATLGSITNAEMGRPYGVAVAPDGNQLLVTDGTLNSVVRIASDPE